MYIFNYLYLQIKPGKTLCCLVFVECSSLLSKSLYYVTNVLNLNLMVNRCK